MTVATTASPEDERRVDECKTGGCRASVRALMLTLLGSIAIFSSGISLAEAALRPVAQLPASTAAAITAATERPSRSAKHRQATAPQSNPVPPGAPPSVASNVVPETIHPSPPPAAAPLPAAAEPSVVAATIPVTCLSDSQQTRISLPWPAPRRYTLGRDGHIVVLSLPNEAHLDVPSLLAVRHRCGQSVGIEAGDDHTLRIHLPANMAARDAQLADALVIDLFQIPTPVAPAGAAADLDPSWPPPVTTLPPLPRSNADPVAATPPPSSAPLRFAWKTPAAAALFRRGSHLWLIFDQPSRQDGDALSHGVDGLQIDQLPHPRATILRLTPAARLTPQLERNGNAWILRLGAGAGMPLDAPITAHPDQEKDGTMRLLLPVAAPAEPLAFTDPEVGDSLVVVPTRSLGAGVTRGYDLAQLRLLPSRQGIVIKPLADDLRVRAFPEGVDVSRVRGLQLSSVSDAARTVASLAIAPPGSRVLPGDLWPVVDPANFTRTLADLNLALSRAAEADRPSALLDLARVYVAAGLGAEALGTFERRQAVQPKVDDGPQERLLHGIAQWLAGHAEAAADDFRAPNVGDTNEGRLWLVLAGADKLDPAMLPAWSTIVADYPPLLRRTASLGLLNAAVDAGAATAAGKLLADLRPLIPDAYATAWFDYQEGRLKRAAGDTDGAVAAWDKVVDGAAADAAARAALDRVELLRHENKMPLQEAIDTLDRLRVTWRGDDLQFRTMRALGQLQSEAGDSLAALRTWREAVSLFPNHPESPALTREMGTVFEHALLDATPTLTQTPPWKTVALFEEFTELLPTDARGQAILAAYAERLVAADLRPQAETVLEKRLIAATNDADKAQTALRLAQLQLSDGKPEAALASAATADRPELPADRQPVRRLVVARALLALGKPDKALATIANDRGPDADALRLSVQRRKGDWEAAATTIERIGDTDSAAPPAPAVRDEQLLDQAAALTLANDQSGLARLRAEPDRPASATPAGAAIDLMTRPNAPIPPKKDAIAAAVSDAEELAAAAKRAAAAPAPSAVPTPPAADATAGH